MSLGIKLEYNPVTGGTPPATTWTDFAPARVAGLKAYWDARVHDNLSTSGAARERVVEALDILIEFDAAHMVEGSDLGDWAAWEAWALAGNGFRFYPLASYTEYYNCVLEDKGWAPVWNGPKKYGAKYVVRVLNDGQAPATPEVVLRRWNGSTS